MPDPHTRPRLLAVAHEASRTGAPTVLLGMLRWLHAHGNVDVHTLLVKGGPLRAGFEAVGSVSAVTDLPGATTLGLLERGLVARGDLRARRVPAALRLRPALVRLGTFDLVYLNSLTTLDLLPHLRGRPFVVAHIHEGPVTIDEWLRSNDPLASRLRPDRWLAVSHDTADAIRAVPGVRPTDVALHHPFIDVATAQGSPTTAAERDELRASLGIPPGARVVVGSGSIERRKGPDLFVQLAGEVDRRRPGGHAPVHFLWVGGAPDRQELRLLQADLRRTGGNLVHVTGHLDDPRAHFQLADVFALTSREDPFPLVCLEHAALGVPIVAYDSSGIRTLLTGAGSAAAAGIVPYLDVGTLATRVLALLASAELARSAGTEVRAAVEAHHDVAVAAPAITRDLGLAVTVADRRGRPDAS